MMKNIKITHDVSPCLYLFLNTSKKNCSPESTYIIRVQYVYIYIIL